MVTGAFKLTAMASGISGGRPCLSVSLSEVVPQTYDENGNKIKKEKGTIQLRVFDSTAVDLSHLINQGNIYIEFHSTKSVFSRIRDRFLKGV